MSNLRQDLKKLKAKGLKKGSQKKFPDLSGDGKVTQKDILIGRGVIKKAVVGKLIKKAAQAISKKIKKRKSSSLPRSKVYEEFELGMDKYLNQTVAKKKYKRLPKITKDAVKITAGIGLGSAAEKAKQSKVKGKAQGGSVVKKAFLGKAITTGAKTIYKKKGKSKKEINKMFDEVKNAKAKPIQKSGFQEAIDVLPGKGTYKLIMPAAVVAVSAGKPNKNKAKSKRKEDKVSKADIIGKGSPKGRAQGGPAPSSKKNKDKSKKTLESLDRAFKKKPKKKKDLIDEIQPDRIFTPGVKGPLRKVSKGGMMIKGQGAAIRGTKFKGTF